MGLSRDIVIVVSPVKIEKYADTKIFVRIGHRELMLILEGAYVIGRTACRKTYENAFQFIKG